MAAHKFVSKHFHKVLPHTLYAYCFGLRAKGIPFQFQLASFCRICISLCLCQCVLMTAANLLVSHIFFSLPAADNTHKMFLFSNFLFWIHLDLLPANWALHRVYLKNSYKHFEMSRNVTENVVCKMSNFGSFYIEFSKYVRSMKNWFTLQMKIAISSRCVRVHTALTVLAWKLNGKEIQKHGNEFMQRNETCTKPKQFSRWMQIDILHGWLVRNWISQKVKCYDRS